MQKIDCVAHVFSRNSNFISYNLKDFLIRSLFQYPPIKYLVVACIFLNSLKFLLF